MEDLSSYEFVSENLQSDEQEAKEESLVESVIKVIRKERPIIEVKNSHRGCEMRSKRLK